MSIWSFFKGKQDQPKVPEWATFFDSKQYAAFQKAVDAYFKGQGIAYQEDDGCVIVNDPKMNFGKLGLLNVAQQCALHKVVADFPKIVNHHFELMRKSQDFMQEFNRKSDDFDFVRPFLGTRIYPKDYGDSTFISHLAYRMIADEMYAMLVYDLPQTVSTVSTKDTEKWGISLDTLFEIGIDNMRENYPPEIRVLDDLPGIYAVIHEHFFGGNILLDLENYPELIGTYGTLLAIPHRHSTLLYPINSVEVVKAISQLLPMINYMYNEGPGQISNQLIWYHDGTYEVLPSRMNDGGIQFIPPDNFAKMLIELAGD
jgi:hypothetical protein